MLRSFFKKVKDFFFRSYKEVKPLPIVEGVPLTLIEQLEKEIKKEEYKEVLKDPNRVLRLEQYRGVGRDYLEFSILPSVPTQIPRKIFKTTVSCKDLPLDNSIKALLVFASRKFVEGYESAPIDKKKLIEEMMKKYRQLNKEGQDVNPQNPKKTKKKRIRRIPKGTR